MDGDKGSGNGNSKDTSYLTVPEKKTIGPLVSEEPRTYHASSELWEPLVPGCLALTFLEWQLDPSETDIGMIPGIRDDRPVAKVTCLPTGGSGFGWQDSLEPSLYDVNQILGFCSRWWSLLPRFKGWWQSKELIVSHYTWDNRCLTTEAINLKFQTHHTGPLA